MSVRQKVPVKLLPARQPEPKWVTATVLGAVSVATIALTGSAADVPLVLGPILVALGIRRS